MVEVDLSVGKVLEITGGSLISGVDSADPRSSMIRHISTDTRTIERGDLFIPLVGERFDGHDFLDQAFANGAVGAVVMRSVPASKNRLLIRVNDTLRALQDIAAWHRSRYDIPVIAITGSNGKTTTKDMVASVLSQRFSTLKTRGNKNNHIGLPQMVLELAPEHQVAVLEMGMSGLGEIRRLCEIAKPTIGVITNIGEAHIEFLKDRDAIARAKGELIESLDENGIGILNADNPYVLSMRKLTKGKVITYGVENNEADFLAEDIRIISGGVRFDVEGHLLEVRVPGRHNVYNALCAVVAGRLLGVDWNDIERGLKNVDLSRNRLDLQLIDGAIVIDDVYNASPTSMRAALDALADVARGRKIAVLGDMLELGEGAPQYHREIGEYAVRSGVDILIAVGNFKGFYAEGAKRLGKENIFLCDDNDSAAEKLMGLMHKGDAILIKGSRNMKMEELMKRLQGEGANLEEV
ncbi:MAG: UDP-N-acetylmuramoyl-tripeptide--D-alanyl-D-alanine ligase [bacterium]